MSRFYAWFNFTANRYQSAKTSGAGGESQNRRIRKDYERLCVTSEAFIYVAMTRLMVRYLANT